MMDWKNYRKYIFYHIFQQRHQNFLMGNNFLNNIFFTNIHRLYMYTIMMVEFVVQAIFPLSIENSGGKRKREGVLEGEEEGTSQRFSEKKVKIKKNYWEARERRFSCFSSSYIKKHEN